MVVHDLEDDVRLLRREARDLADDLGVRSDTITSTHDGSNLGHGGGLVITDDADDLSVSYGRFR